MKKGTAWLKKNWKPLLIGAAVGAGATQGIPPGVSEMLVNLLLSLFGV